MTEQVKKEIIKAYAYGKTPQEAAAAMADREIYSHSDGTRYCKNGKRYSQNQRRCV